MQEKAVLLLPSPNSAFTWTGGRTCSVPVCPSHSLRKRLLFGADPVDRNDLTTEVNAVIRHNQSAFEKKWKCRCDVIVRSCDSRGLNPVKRSKIPKYDWSPIEKAVATDGCSIPNELNSFHVNDTLSDAGSRPGSPIPFSPAPSAFTPQSGFSSSDSRILTSSDLPEACLTPPSSPDTTLIMTTETSISSQRNLTSEHRYKMCEL